MAIIEIRGKEYKIKNKKKIGWEGFKMKSELLIEWFLRVKRTLENKGLEEKVSILKTESN